MSELFRDVSGKMADGSAVFAADGDWPRYSAGQELAGSFVEVDDHVEKWTGEARWTGFVVAKYKTRRGKLRYVVEVEPQGFQMIAVPGQLRLYQPEVAPVPAFPLLWEEASLRQRLKLLWKMLLG